MNGTSDSSIANITKPVLEEKTFNKLLNGRQVEKETTKNDEIDLTEDKSPIDSAKTFSSFKANPIQFQTLNTQKPSDSSPLKSSLFAFAKNDDKASNKPQETLTSSSSSGNLFKFGITNGASSSSSSSISSNLSSASETSNSKADTGNRKTLSRW